MKRLIKKANFKTLIIVDIQKDFYRGFDLNYLEKVKSLINQGWDMIITVVDDNMGESLVPDFIAHNSDKILHKTYGFDFEYIQELAEEGEIETIGDDEAYRYNDELVIKGNVHEWFNVPKDMELAFKELQAVTLIGGADDECLDDIENSLIYLGVEVQRNNSCIYNGYSLKEDDTWTYDINWVEV